MKKIVAFSFFIIHFSLSITPALSQTAKLSEDPTQFVADVQKMMSVVVNPDYAKATKNLETVWLDNRLTASQQKLIIATSRRLAAKGYKASIQFQLYFNSIYANLNGKNAALPALDGYLNTANQVVDLYDGKNIIKFFDTAFNLFNDRLLYNTNYNKLYIQGGSFTFRMSDATSELIKTVESSKAAANSDGWGNMANDTTGGVSGPMFYQKKMIPDLSGAIIDFKNVNLAFVTQNDSVLLIQTNGKVAVREGTWVGTGGKFDWQVAGDPSVYATLSLYSFNINTPKISADDAMLHHDKKLTKPIEGAFEFESKRRPKSQLSSFPRFISYKNDAVLRSLSKNVQYKGGLSLIGLKESSASLSDEPASIEVLKNGKIAFRATSRRFELSDTLITSPLASFVTYIGDSDSLYHPGIKLSYSEPNGLVKCARADGTGFKFTPYSNSYHKVYIEAEMLRWNFSKNELEFLMIGGRTVVPIKLESFGYFKPERFRAISQEFGMHPLSLAANYMIKQKVRNFLPEDLATYYKKEPNVMRGMYNQMFQSGYVNIDNNGVYSLNQKGILYVSANNKQTDFDNFKIEALFAANDNTANAAINLKDNVLTIRGVSEFVISDSLKIMAYPSDKTVRMFKNRDFMMNGLLKSANLKFTGRDLQFNYDKFFVDLNKIDKITFVPRAAYDKGGGQEVGGDVVYEKSGRIYLNDPKNKSGAGKNSVFPRLTVPEGMTVYFDQPDRGNLVYNRKVFFKIPSIDYDSLGIQDLVFVGNFNSDGIFPAFAAQLKSMSDNSLGFVYSPPAVGFDVYGTKTHVKFSKEITMDKQGLRTEGEISHLSAKIPTQAMLFTSDSLIASGAEAEIKEATIGKTYFPKVDLRNFTMKWQPKQDSMTLTTKGNFFNFYSGTTKLEGRIVLRSSGLYGKGFLKRTDSELTSQDIKFNKEGFLAGNSEYKILSGENNSRPVLLGKTVDIDFNIVKGLVNISSNERNLESVSSLEFPFAAYRTSISRAQWNINAKIIAMKGDVNTSSFTSTAPEQEGLTFNGSAALYEIEKMTLNISGVPFIKSADAKVIPEKGLVVIRRNSEMMPFQRARLVLDTLNEYHRLKNGNIQIVSHNKFTGDATYLYTTVLNDTIPVKMGNFELRQAIIAIPTNNTDNKKSKITKQSNLYSVARAEIAEIDKFVIAPKLQYKGRMTMLAPEANLQFDGFVKPLIKPRSYLTASWVQFKENPSKNISLKITPTLKNETEQPISVGLYYRNGVEGLYSTFLSPKEARNDVPLFTANGLLSYDEKVKVYKIAPAPKIKDELVDEAENSYTFDDQKGTVSYFGRMNIVGERGVKEGEEMFLSAGSVQAILDSSAYKFNTLLAMNFPASSTVMKRAGETIVATNLEEQHSDAAEPDWDRLRAKLSQLIGKKPAESYVNRAAGNYRGLAESSPKMAATIVLSNVNLKWSPIQNTFYSIGKIGVSNLGNTDINAQMEGMLEIRKSQRGDEISLYIEASPEVWYYFDWQDGKLAMVSSIQEENDLLTVKSKGEKKEAAIIPIEVTEKALFVERFITLYRPRTPKKTPVKTKTTTPTAAKQPTTTTNGKKQPAPVVAATPVDEETVAEDTKTTKSKDTKTTVKDGKVATTDPKAKNSKTVPTKATKPSKKEEEKEGF
jgi:hypothetical protein